MSDATNKSSSNKASDLPLIIVNPTSAGGETAKIWAKTASDFAKHFGAFTVEFTRGQGDGKRIAAEAAKNGRKFIIACGGDGTINEVANGILESGVSDAELGIIPSGTGGDFRRSLSIPTNPAKAARFLREGTTKQIDVGRVTFTNQSGELTARYFLGVASFGLSTAVINRVKVDKPFAWLPIRSLSGRASFAWSTLQTTLEMNYTRVKAQIDDGRERELSVVNFCVANGCYFGGGMKIAPDAKLDDGYFDIVMISEISSTKILANSHKLYLGTHLDVPEVHHTRARKLKIEALNNEIIPFEIDGELPANLPATFEIIPQALKIRSSK